MRRQLSEQFKRMQKLAGIITEATPAPPASTTPAQKSTPEEEAELKAMAKDNYTTFVQKLGTNIIKPGFQDAIKKLADKAPIATKNMSVPVTKLKPTQNEIDVDKSLKFPLTDPNSAQTYLKGGNVSVAGKNIITGGGGSFIIDGHHRWSQLYCVNPQASITSIDVSGITDPMAGLKATQLGIAGNIGKVPVATVQGQNLLKMGKEPIVAYITKTITPEVVKIFSQAGKGNDAAAIAQYIWTNVELMQKNNQPVAGAPGRGIMPQTDDATNWEDDAVNVQALKERRLQQEVNEVLRKHRNSQLS